MAITTRTTDPTVEPTEETSVSKLVRCSTRSRTKLSSADPIPFDLTMTSVTRAPRAIETPATRTKASSSATTKTNAG